VSLGIGALTDSGTDEFMHWLEVLSKGSEKRVEPYICLNMGTGTLDEALAWVEYCNSTKNTYYANLRRKNGREKPYNVKYWALGNEVRPGNLLASQPN
jgi:alpha-L-arabinofuranosidase